MPSLNRVQLMGHLGGDPELRFTPGGKGVSNFTIATTYGSGDNQSTEWHRCVIWDGNGNATRAQWVSKFKKGDLVYAEGRIQTRTWEDKDGNKRYQTEVICDRCDYMRSKGMVPTGTSREATPDDPMSQFGALTSVDPDDVPF